MEKIRLAVQNLEERVVKMETQISKKTTCKDTDEKEVLFLGRPINANQGSWSPGSYSPCSPSKQQSGFRREIKNQKKKIYISEVTRRLPKTAGRRERTRGFQKVRQQGGSQTSITCSLLPYWVKKTDFVRERSNKRRKKNMNATERPEEKVDEFHSTCNF